MGALKRSAAVAVGVVAGLGLIAAPASAAGSSIGGSGYQYFLNDAFSGSANTVFAYGDAGDDVYAGDWDGNGTDTLAVRRGNTFYVRNTNSSGSADLVFSYGDRGDTVLVGDWDGNGTDTLAVRRGNTFYVKNSTSTGVADTVFSYGDRGDTVLVGDWDGDGTDSLAIRRGNTYFVKNTMTTGRADWTFVFGDPGDTVLVGNWDGDTSAVGATTTVTTDTLAVRRGNHYYVRNSNSSGIADYDVVFGDPGDVVLVGDWAVGGVSGDYADQLAVRRGNRYVLSAELWTAEGGHDQPLPAAATVAFGDPGDTAFAAQQPYTSVLPDGRRQTLLGDGIAVRR
jgi:hypothetical protein